MWWVVTETGDVLLQGSESDDEDNEVARDEEIGEIRVRRSTMQKMLGRRHRTKKEALPKLSLKELLKLNKPDWLLVLIGVVCSAVIGCLFPLMAILFSEVLRVGLSLIQQCKMSLSPL